MRVVHELEVGEAKKEEGEGGGGGGGAAQVKWSNLQAVTLHISGGQHVAGKRRQIFSFPFQSISLSVSKGKARARASNVKVKHPIANCYRTRSFT